MTQFLSFSFAFDSTADETVQQEGAFSMNSLSGEINRMTQNGKKKKLLHFMRLSYLDKILFSHTFFCSHFIVNEDDAISMKPMSEEINSPAATKKGMEIIRKNVTF